YINQFDYSLAPRTVLLRPEPDSGFFDRVEREDLGFGHIKITRGAVVPATGEIIGGDRSVVHRFYHNHSYYLRGLLREEYEIDGFLNLMRGLKVTYEHPG